MAALFWTDFVQAILMVVCALIVMISAMIEVEGDFPSDFFS